MAAFAAQLGLLVLESAIADRFQRHVEHRLVVAAIVFEHFEILVDDFIVVGERIGRNQIPPPDLGRVDVQLMGGEIQQSLHHEHAVLAAGAPIWRDGRQIGEHLRKGAVVVRHDIGAEQGALAVDRHRQPIRIIGAAVVQKHVLDTKDAAIICQGDLGVMNLPALMGGGEEMLKPVLDPLDRPVQFHRHPWQQHFLGIEHHDLRAETAADEGCDHADLPFVEAEHAGETVAHEHRRLCGIPDRHLVGARIPLRDDAAGFDRRRDAVLVEKAAPDDMVGGGHGSRIVTLGLPQMRGDVGTDVVVDQR